MKLFENRKAVTTLVKIWVGIKIITMVFTPFILKGQTVLNGSFENNLLVADAINYSNTAFDSVMENCNSFGSCGNIDVVKSCGYCNAVADDGQWFVSLTGGGTDVLSLKLSQPLISGNTYKITFYNKFCLLYANLKSSRVLIGLSAVADSMGTIITTTRAPVNDEWLQNSVTFKSPIAGQYLTVQLETGTAHDTWVQFDNFSIEVAAAVNDYEQQSEIAVYPNPASSKVTIESTTAIDGVDIYDSTGSLLYSIVPGKDANTVEPEISAFPAGIYVLGIHQGNSIVERKIMKITY